LFLPTNLLTSPGFGESRPTKSTIEQMPPQLETQYAQRTAPAMRDQATVYLLDPRAGYQLSRQGTSGVTCLVERNAWEQYAGNGRRRKLQNGVTAAFLCAAPVSAGQMTIPAYVLLNLAASGPPLNSGQMTVGNRAVSTITIPGLDIASIAYSSAFTVNPTFQ
jgi:hypothetical protein